MNRSSDIADVSPGQWCYASLTVLDGTRAIKPAQVSFDMVIFDQPPRLTSEHIEIIVINGAEEDRHVAHVLPHDPDATLIPIRLMNDPH